MGDRSSQRLDSAVFKIGDRVSAHAKAGSRLTLRFFVLEAHLHHLQFVGSEFCEGCHEDLTQLLALDPIQGVFRYQVGEEALVESGSLSSPPSAGGDFLSYFLKA